MQQMRGVTDDALPRIIGSNAIEKFVQKEIKSEILEFQCLNNVQNIWFMSCVWVLFFWCHVLDCCTIQSNILAFEAGETFAFDLSIPIFLFIIELINFRLQSRGVSYEMDWIWQHGTIHIGRRNFHLQIMCTKFNYSSQFRINYMNEKKKNFSHSNDVCCRLMINLCTYVLRISIFTLL